MSARPALREPMLWLVLALPLASVVAGVLTWRVAARAPADPIDTPVRRVAQVQTADLAPDRRAAALGLRATFAIDSGDRSIAVRIGAADAGLPDALALRLRHPLRAAGDADVMLARARDGGYAGSLPALGGSAYHLVLEAADGDWRLVGHLPRGARRGTLRPAFDAGR